MEMVTQVDSGQTPVTHLNVFALLSTCRKCNLLVGDGTFECDLDGRVLYTVIVTSAVLRTARRVAEVALDFGNTMLGEQ